MKTFGVVVGAWSKPKKTTVGEVIRNRPRRRKTIQNVIAEMTNDKIEIGMLMNSMPAL